MGVTKWVNGFPSIEHPLYKKWVSMKQRCFNQSVTNYKNYGGRGITVCERWLTFSNFAEDMYPTYKKGLTLDRINNDSGYSPDNCRWATRKEQGNNRRTNLLVNDSSGKMITVTQLSKELGINSRTLLGRFQRASNNIEAAVYSQGKEQPQYCIYQDGSWVSLSEAARLNGVDRSTISKRLNEYNYDWFQVFQKGKRVGRVGNYEYRSLIGYRAS